MFDDEQQDFIEFFNDMMAHVHQNAINKGFWESKRSSGESIALMHSELSEALEADRKDLIDNHLAQYSGVTVELADCIIRIMDFAYHTKLPLAEAIIDKHLYNLTRPHLHGKKF
jgi:NTP pyrophosphatase (non-canonical NTP hydrolase)